MHIRFYEECIYNTSSRRARSIFVPAVPRIMSMSFPVEITFKALLQFKRSLKKRGSGTIRLGVLGGGCSGFQYSISFEDEPTRKTDLVLLKEEPFEALDIQDDFEPVQRIEFRVDKKSAVILDGSVLDYIDTGLIGRGFSFTNPQEKSKCGCGVSFNV